jgi:hypothetical protein
VLAPNAEILRTAKDAASGSHQGVFWIGAKSASAKLGFHTQPDSTPTLPREDRMQGKARRWSRKAGLIAKLRRNSAPPDVHSAAS